jgi:hypothetical protein
MIENNEKLIDMLAGGALYSTYAKEKAEKAAEKAISKEESAVADQKQRSAGGSKKDGGSRGHGGSKRSGATKEKPAESGPGT